MYSLSSNSLFFTWNRQEKCVFIKQGSQTLVHWPLWDLKDTIGDKLLKYKIIIIDTIFLLLQQKQTQTSRLSWLRGTPDSSTRPRWSRIWSNPSRGSWSTRCCWGNSTPWLTPTARSTTIWTVGLNGMVFGNDFYHGLSFSPWSLAIKEHLKKNHVLLLSKLCGGLSQSNHRIYLH